eukprot:1855096-Pyramimonas_sp.AAC.1
MEGKLRPSGWVGVVWSEVTRGAPHARGARHAHTELSTRGVPQQMGVHPHALGLPHTWDVTHAA